MRLQPFFFLLQSFGIFFSFFLDVLFSILFAIVASLTMEGGVCVAGLHHVFVSLMSNLAGLFTSLSLPCSQGRAGEGVGKKTTTLLSLTRINPHIAAKKWGKKVFFFLYTQLPLLSPEPRLGKTCCCISSSLIPG